MTLPRDRRRWDEDPDLRAHVDRLLVQLSQDINLFRENADWSQAALAHAAGVGDATVLGIEKARIDPRLSTIVRLAFACGYQVDVRFRRPRRAVCPSLSRRISTSSA